MSIEIEGLRSVGLHYIKLDHQACYETQSTKVTIETYKSAVWEDTVGDLMLYMGANDLEYSPEWSWVPTQKGYTFSVKGYGPEVDAVLDKVKAEGLPKFVTEGEYQEHKAAVRAAHEAALNCGLRRTPK